MQAIYTGDTKRSCPNAKAPLYKEAMEYRLHCLPSMSGTYWSTQVTMQNLVETIIAPYFDEQKKQLGREPTQFSLWKIDCWSVHKSQEFCLYMKENYPYIILCFVPGNCTGLWQPLDVGIQHVLKLSMKCASH